MEEGKELVWNILNLCWQPAALWPSSAKIGLYFDILYCVQRLNEAQRKQIFSDDWQWEGATYSLWTGEGSVLPYRCKWGNCPRRFDILVNCQIHEAGHIGLSGVGDGVNP